MDLLTTLSSAGGGSTANLGAMTTTGDGSEGAGGSGAAADDRFVATLAELLAPLPADVGSFAEVVPTGEAGEEPDVDGAVTWPLGLLFAATSTARDGQDADIAPADAEAEDAEALADAPLPGAQSAPDADATATSAVSDAEDAAVDTGQRLASAGTVPASVAEDAGQVEVEAPDTQPAASSHAGRTRPDATGATIDAPPEESVDELSVARASRRSDAASDRGEHANRVSERTAPRSATEEPARSSDAPLVDATRGTGPAAAGSGRATGLSDGLRRVLEAIDRLENAPPPRQLTIDAGEARLRVALDESNQIRLTVLQGASDDVDELLRSVEEALTERGFDLDPGGRGDGGERSHDDTPATSAPSPSARTQRAATRGLRL